MLISEPLGPKIRKQRRRLGLTLDELAGRTGISKPYLSLIETSRVPNPPSDEKLRRIEQTLGFTTGELLTHAHLQRTPHDIRAMLSKLLSQNKIAGGYRRQCAAGIGGRGGVERRRRGGGWPSAAGRLAGLIWTRRMCRACCGRWWIAPGANVEKIASNAVPVINCVSAGYPKDFTDLSYPPRVADEYVGCPELSDKDAFGARVHGDSMTPKYREGDIVIFSPALPPRNGDDCFVRFADGQTTFKRIFFEADQGSRPAGHSVAAA